MQSPVRSYFKKNERTKIQRQYVSQLSMKIFELAISIYINY